VIRALILDFDGLVLDTESSVYESWRRSYQEQGVDLPLDLWCRAIGGDGSAFDPLGHLRAQVAELSEEDLQRRRRHHRDSMLEGLAPLPGVEQRLREARSLGIPTAIASSPTRDWVEPHLERTSLRSYFDVLVTADDVSRTKPDPELYLRALDALDAPPAGALAIEDSPNGVQAARAAGVYCLAVPGPMTRALAFPTASRRLASLAEHSLGELISEMGLSG